MPTFMITGLDDNFKQYCYQSLHS